MADFGDAELRRLDLTLLLVFEEAMASGKLSAAARRLGLTQSAISHALKRLRDIFDDELFVRTPRGVQPTPRAVALRAPLSEALRLIADAVRPEAFDPASTDRVFRIAAPDLETSLFAPVLAQPDIGPRFVFRPLIRQAAIQALLAAEVDRALGFSGERSEGCDSTLLFEEDYVVVARAEHPAMAIPLDLDAYTSAGHVLIAPGGTLGGIVDPALAAAGHARRVVVAVPYFLAALATVAASNLIATVPRRLALAHAASFGLVTAEPPLAIRRFTVRMTWGRRSASDPGLAWLRGRMVAAAARMAHADVSGSAIYHQTSGP
jgi:DNA-binding transcriptional LysR family regulator